MNSEVKGPSSRSKEILASAYLTLASIIQRVALAALVQRFRGALAGAMALLALVTWAVYGWLGLGHVKLGVALTGLGVVIVYAASSVPYWNRLDRNAHRSRE